MTRSTIKGPQNGGIVFNEDSADVDFRVESNGNINMLHVDGGGEVVTIGGLTGTAGNEDAGYGPLQIGNTADSNPILQFLSTTSGVPTIHFGDAVSGDGRYQGYQIYDHGNNWFRFGTGGNDNLRLVNSVTGSGFTANSGSSVISHPIHAIRATGLTRTDSYYDFTVYHNGGLYIICGFAHDQTPSTYGKFANFQVGHNATYVTVNTLNAYGGNGSIGISKTSTTNLRVTFNKDESSGSGSYGTIEFVAILGANPF